MEYGETVNHYYSPRDRLGQGAFSTVYLGFNKVTGEKRALKVPKRPGIDKATQRETGALLSLKHRNIVQFYGIEDEMSCNKTVIVMEYCSGGSLHDMLLEPEYARGLPDTIFLQLLTQLADGVKELNFKDFVHRDIKPANILITKSVPNVLTFKISDFGSSKQNHSPSDEEMFLSLAGTEEYLHPLIYKGAFIQKSPHVKANSCVDKWALGVTLYHASTGDVPFKPYGGARKNRQTMFLMISQKPRGKISGVQETEHGRIQWSSEFPNTCNLSSGMKARMTPIMAGLMEADNSHQWSYDSFFRGVDLLNNAVPVHILNMCNLQYYTLYLYPNDRLSLLYEMIATETDIARRYQVLFFDNKHLDNIVNVDTVVKQLPKTSKDNPILLLSVIDCDIFNCSNIQTEITSLDNANLRNEVLVKVARKGSRIIANICNTVTDIHMAKKSVQNFINESRERNATKIEEIKKDFHLMSLIAEEKLSRLTFSNSTSIGTLRQDVLPLKSRGSSCCVVSPFTKENPLKSESACNSLSQTVLQMKNIREYIRDVLSSTDNLIQETQKSRPIGTQTLCTSECVDTMRNYLKNAKDTLVDILKQSSVREKSPLDVIRNKNARDNILNLVYKARNHWTTTCDCDKRMFLNNVQEILRMELNISGKIHELTRHLEEFKDILTEDNNPSYGETLKFSVTCSEDLPSILKENTQLETDGLILDGKESLEKFIKESDEFESLLESIKLTD